MNFWQKFLFTCGILASFCAMICLIASTTEFSTIIYIVVGLGLIFGCYVINEHMTPAIPATDHMYQCPECQHTNMIQIPAGWYNGNELEEFKVWDTCESCRTRQIITNENVVQLV